MRIAGITWRSRPVGDSWIATTIAEIAVIARYGERHWSLTINGRRVARAYLTHTEAMRAAPCNLRRIREA